MTDHSRPLNTLAAIATYFDVNGYWPSVRDIGEDIGVGSTGHVKSILTKLEASGLLYRKGQISRAMNITVAGYAALGVARRMPAAHGTRSSYVMGCHCPACTAANTSYRRRWRERRREASA